DAVDFPSAVLQHAHAFRGPFTNHGRIDLTCPRMPRCAVRCENIARDSFHSVRGYRPECGPAVPTGYPWQVARRESGTRPSGTLHPSFPMILKECSQWLPCATSVARDLVSANSSRIRTGVPTAGGTRT